LEEKTNSHPIVPLLLEVHDHPNLPTPYLLFGERSEPLRSRGARPPLDPLTLSPMTPAGANMGGREAVGQTEPTNGLVLSAGRL